MVKETRREEEAEANDKDVKLEGMECKVCMKGRAGREKKVMEKKKMCPDLGRIEVVQGQERTK